MQSKTLPEGIQAILFALFDDQEQLDRDLMRRQTDICVAAGAHGIAALGLATEVAKLTEGERRTIMDWAAEDVAGRLPLSFTITGNSVGEQIAQLRHAESVGADWLILQPPLVGQYPAEEYIRFFGRVADAAQVPVAIQNAPAYMGRGLAEADVMTLVAQHGNIQILKAEGPVIEVARVIEATQGQVRVFNGRGGLELIDNLRAGCSGMVLAPDLIDLAVMAYEHFRRGEETAAEAVYGRMLPGIAFVMQSLEYLICYGKRLFGLRAGMPIHDRAPALPALEPGLSIVGRLAGQLGPY